MIDYFAVLDVERQAWLDPDQLQKRFLELSAAHHPDRHQNAAEKKTAEQRFAEINTAYQVLRSAKSRLHHLLHLQTGLPPDHVQQVPSDAMALFPAVAETIRTVDTFLAGNTPEASPMLRVQRFEAALSLTDRVQQVQAAINEKILALESEIHASREPISLPRLRHLAAAFGFLEKWNGQLADKLARLSEV